MALAGGSRESAVVFPPLVATIKDSLREVLIDFESNAPYLGIKITGDATVKGNLWPSPFIVDRGLVMSETAYAELEFSPPIVELKLGINTNAGTVLAVCSDGTSYEITKGANVAQWFEFVAPPGLTITKLRLSLYQPPNSGGYRLYIDNLTMRY